MQVVADPSACAARPDLGSIGGGKIPETKSGNPLSPCLEEEEDTPCAKHCVVQTWLTRHAEKARHRKDLPKMGSMD